jgi:hypothetical protein
MLKTSEIHRKLCAAVYGQNVMSEGTKTIVQNVQRWAEQMFTMKGEVVGHL